MNNVFRRLLSLFLILTVLAFTGCGSTSQPTPADMSVRPDTTEPVTDPSADSSAPDTAAPDETVPSEKTDYDSSVISVGETCLYPVIDPASGQSVVLENGETLFHIFEYPVLNGPWENADAFNRKMASFGAAEREKAESGNAGDKIYRVGYQVSVLDNILAVGLRNEIGTADGVTGIKTSGYYFDLTKDTELKQTGYLTHFGVSEKSIVDALLADDTFYDLCEENGWHPTYDEFVNPNFDGARFTSVRFTEQGDAVLGLYLSGFPVPYQEFVLPGILQ